jgi:sugar lactone lactonase YvrE
MSIYSRRRLLVLIALLTLSIPAFAKSGDTKADAILGQKRFSTVFPFFVDGTVLDSSDVAIDRSATPNRVYVASPDLNRVLGWSDLGRFLAGLPADLVLGQPSAYNATSSRALWDCPGVPSATSLCRPNRVAVSPHGDLYVVDAYNARVLEFDRPFATDRVADRVFGQESFSARLLPDSRLIATPEFLDVAVDGQGNVWMIDPAATRRILEYDVPLPPGPQGAPDRVIEPTPDVQCSFTAQVPCQPYSLEINPQGDLYVQDARLTPYFRELVYLQPLATGLTPDFTLRPLPGARVPSTGVFDAAGNLYVLSDGVWRYPAPIGPATEPELVSATRQGYGERLAIDTAGRIYAADYRSLLEEASFVWVRELPYQQEPVPVGRPLISDRGLREPNVLAVDRGSSPNHLYVVDGYQRVLGWRDAEGFRNGDPADLVLVGSQPGTPGVFGSCSGALPGPSQFCPYGDFTRGGLAVDSRGNLWMSDPGNHRVLEFERPFESDGVADRVLGQQGSLTSRTCNLGGVGQRSLCYPGALAFDRQDRLYVADVGNNRVLLFERPRTSDTASRVFGQPSFARIQCNQGRGVPGAATLCLGVQEGESNPHLVGAAGLAVDPKGNLYVADVFNSRVLIYRDPLTSDTAADVVLGQDNFSQDFHGTGPRRFAQGLLAVAVSPDGDLYVADPGNDRVLEFRNPLKDRTADRVFGHAGFATGGFHPDGFHPLPPADAANFLRPEGVAVDALGNLYVADTFYSRVLRFDQP